MTVFYENSFNLNEWFVIISLIVSGFLIWKTPKLFSRLEMIAYFLFGVAYGMFYDHTISVKPWDFYDVNDNSSYQLIDFLSYVMYGGYSYFFLYLYKKLKIRGISHLLYVVIWSGFSLLMEWITLKIGLFHFDKGYRMFWSFPIYVTAQTMLIIFYQIVNKKKMQEEINDVKT